MKKPLLTFGLLCIAAGTVAVGVSQTLVPSSGPKNREEALGAAAAQMLFIFAGLVLIIVHFVRARGGGKQAPERGSRFRSRGADEEGDWDSEERPSRSSAGRRGNRSRNATRPAHAKGKDGIPLWAWLLGGAACLFVLGGGIALLLSWRGNKDAGQPAGAGLSNRPQAQPRPVLPPSGRAGEEFGARIGMTEAELIDQLGPPSEEKSEPNKKQLKWFKGNQVLWVTLIDGKASGIAVSSR